MSNLTNAQAIEDARTLGIIAHALVREAGIRIIFDTIDHIIEVPASAEHYCGTSTVSVFQGRAQVSTDAPHVPNGLNHQLRSADWADVVEAIKYHRRAARFHALAR